MPSKTKSIKEALINLYYSLKSNEDIQIIKNDKVNKFKLIFLNFSLICKKKMKLL